MVHVHLWPRCLEIQGHYRQSRAVTGCGLASGAQGPACSGHTEAQRHKVREVESSIIPLLASCHPNDPRHQPHIPRHNSEDWCAEDGISDPVTCRWRDISKLRLPGLAWVPRGSRLKPHQASSQPQAALTDLAASIPHLHGAVVGGVGPPSSWVDPAQVIHVVADKAVS